MSEKFKAIVLNQSGEKFSREIKTLDKGFLKFEDKDFINDDRQALYYARAIQEPTETINGDALRCTYDDKGNCLEVNPCYGDYRIDKADQCLTKIEHRAWSSPIFVSNINNEQ